MNRLTVWWARRKEARLIALVTAWAEAEDLCERLIEQDPDTCYKLRGRAARCGIRAIRYQAGLRLHYYRYPWLLATDAKD